MGDNGRHVCMLPREPEYYDLPPTAGYFRLLLCKIRDLQLPCEWHHATKLFIRSQKSLKVERDRQLSFSHWFIWHPYSPIKYYWDCLIMFTNYFILIYLAIEVFKVCPEPFGFWIIFADVIGFLDICTKFITGNDQDDDGNNVILQPKEIAVRYLRGTFIFDLISSLPLQFIKFYENCHFPTHTAWYMLKLLRLISMRKQWKNWYRQLGMSYGTAVTITVAVHVILFFHWMTFVYYQIPLFCINIYKFDGTGSTWLLHIYNLNNKTVLKKYSTSFFYVCGLVIGAGYYKPVTEYIIVEQIMNAILGIIGLIFLIYSFTTLVRLAFYQRLEIFLYNGRLKQLQDYMVFKQLPNFLQRKIKLYLNYKFYEHYYNESAILNTINEQIKQDINMFCCKRLMLNVPLFQELPTALINAIVFSLKQEFYMPGETVVKCGQPGQSLYLIYSGTVAVINSSGREVAHLRDGSYFGDMALLEPGSLQSSTMIALEITEMFKLSSKDYQACLQPYPHLKRRLEDKQNTERHNRPYN